MMVMMVTIRKHLNLMMTTMLVMVTMVMITPSKLSNSIALSMFGGDCLSSFVDEGTVCFFVKYFVFACCWKNSSNKQEILKKRMYSIIIECHHHDPFCRYCRLYSMLHRLLVLIVDYHHLLLMYLFR
jgi:hypothetical protein